VIAAVQTMHTFVLLVAVLFLSSQ